MCFLSHEEFFFFELPTEIIRNKLFSYDPWPGQPIKLKLLSAFQKISFCVW